MCNHHIGSGKYSSIFFYQMVAAMANIARNGRNGVHITDVHHVMWEIDYLEGRSSATATKGPLPFKDPMLNDLMHKHVSSAGDFVNNLMRELPRTTKKMHKFIEAEIGNIFTEEHAKKLSYMAVYEAYTERASRRTKSAKKGLTGEWIVYKNINGINYYLFFGYHEMNNSDLKSLADAACIDIGIY